MMKTVLIRAFFATLLCAAALSSLAGTLTPTLSRAAQPLAQGENAASVTGNGVTTYFATLEEAWTDAISSKYASTDVVVTLLKDATIQETLVRTVINFIGWTLSLDLNDHVLAYAGESNACVVEQTGGMALHIIDTATTRTPRYFTCDETTGLWTLTNEVTDFTVSGGLITGGRAGAVRISYGPQTNVIRNVNFVGNWQNSGDGGAVWDASGTLEITNSAFFGNVSSANGGAISAGIPCQMTDCRVAANVASGFGGGVHLKRCGSLVRTEVCGNHAGTGGGVYLTYQTSFCLLAGTKIQMADGSQRNIESITAGDMVRTFDHVGGTNSSAAVFYVYSGEGARDVFRLVFASGAMLDIVDRHDLLFETTRKYVTISSECARSFVGKRFYNAALGEWDELVEVQRGEDGGAYYSIYTRGHGNCVANGFLTMPDDKDCFINVYELDEGLKADADQLAADIATYGLATPDDYPNIPLSDFEDGNVRYAFIAIGKGLTSQEEMLFWNEFDYGPVVTKGKITTCGLKIPAPSYPYLQVGEDAVITGNVSAVGTDNAYLTPGMGQKAVIDVLPGATDVAVGVTLSSGAGIFGWTNMVNYAASFASDNSAYTISYTADGELALREGIQVGADAWAVVGSDRICTISGTGAMWNHDAWTAGNPLAAYQRVITNLVVESGITAVGSQFFYRFQNLNTVTCAESVTAVGNHAFYRCNSLESLAFAGSPTLGESTFTIQSAIYMKEGLPVIYTIPAVSLAGYVQKLYGTNDLGGEWTEITTEQQKAEFHFFKTVLVAQ